MDAELRELCERLRNAADKAEETCDVETDANCTFLPFTIASMRTMLAEAADTLAAQAAELEGVRKDAARLDWMESNARCIVTNATPAYRDGRVIQPISRAAIDTAIADSGAGGG